MEALPCHILCYKPTERRQLWVPRDTVAIVPTLDAVLVFVLIAASLTVKKDYLRLKQRMEAAASAAAAS